MTHFPSHISGAEAKLINAFLTRALSAGYHVRVFDGEEWATGYTRDRAEIQRETAATCETTFRLAKPSEMTPGKWAPLGNVLAVHGNEEDVLSDASASKSVGKNTSHPPTWSRYVPRSSLLPPGACVATSGALIPCVS